MGREELAALGDGCIAGGEKESGGARAEDVGGVPLQFAGVSQLRCVFGRGELQTR